MRQNISTAQAGYALILMVLALMGVGGIVLAGFTQGVKVETEHERYLHNQRVLREAKQALLQYAYNNPVTNGFGPGRLPNADTDNDGVAEGGSTFGRLPWASPNLNLYDIRDADGQRLWYAVSSAFRPQAAAINSSTSGTITLRSQSGNVIFDGSNPAALTQYGVAALIIAPGAVIDRNGVSQDRSVTNGDDPFDYTDGDDTDEDTDPGIIAASNYLDLVVGTEDNSGFTNGDASDGLVLGPVNNLTNDQFIVITAAEVIAMAEKATLQAYRRAIDDYLDKVACSGETPDGIGTTETLCLANGGSWDPVYPWLYNYDGIEYDEPGGEPVSVAIAKLSTYFPAFANFTDEDDFLGFDTSGSDGHYGRIPSIFAEYFERTDSRPFESDLRATVTIDYEAITPVPSTISHGSLPLLGDGVNPPVHVLEVTIPAAELTNLRFTDDAAGSNRRLTADLAAAQTYNQLVYFWDEAEGPRTGVWRLCPSGGDELSDCHRDSSQNPTPGGSNDSKEEILKLDLEVNLPAGTITFDASAMPAIAISAADSSAHAAITGTFQGDDLDLSAGTSPDVSVSWQYDAHYYEGETFFIEEQDDLSMADLTSNTTLALELRYYPELPAWAYDNGWHNSIRMAYAVEYEPGTGGSCTIDATCLKLDDSPGTPQDKISLLVIAGQHDWTDTDLNGRLKNDLLSVFDGGNENNNSTFYRHRGNDNILVIDEL